jgi:predicted amidohydrolase YtcJ
MRVPDDKIRSLRSVLTVVDGKVVHDQLQRR